MSRIYFALLLLVILGWLLVRVPLLTDFGSASNWRSLLGITAVYFCSHVFRMLRLALLTLDERDKVLPLIRAHALTAFPSSFLPFKIGEVIRLGAFFNVYEGRRKALAVWLAERFGDVVVIVAFITALKFFSVDLPAAMRTVFVVFVLVAALGLLGMFAVSKTFVYLNRHLVLTSHTERGLKLLRASHVLQQLEADIHRSITGRLSGLVLLSVLVWMIEILALSLFIHQFTVGEPDFSELFASGLLASLPGGTAGGAATAFGLYQSLALIVLALLYPIWWLVAHLHRRMR